MRVCLDVRLIYEPTYDRQRLHSLGGIVQTESRCLEVLIDEI